jgi:hypothetical protein
MERAWLLVVLLAFSSMAMLTEPSDLSAQAVPLSGPHRLPCWAAHTHGYLGV